MLCRMVGLRPEGFGIFIGLLMFEALIAITVGLCVSAAVPTVGTYFTLLYSTLLYSTLLYSTLLYFIHESKLLHCFHTKLYCHYPFLFSYILANAEAANALGPPLMIIGILFAGFYIKISSLPIVANWVPYFSFFHWTFQVRQTLSSVAK